MLKKILQSLTAVIAAAGFLLPAAAYEQTYFRLGITLNGLNSQKLLAKHFAEELDRQTDSLITVEIEQSPAPAYSDELLYGVSNGQLDMAIVTLGSIIRHDESFLVLTLPFLFKDYAHAHRTIDNSLFSWTERRISALNVRSLAMLDYGFHQITTTDREVKELKDLRGLTMGVFPKKGLANGFEVLGVKATDVPHTRIKRSLKNGTIDSQEDTVYTILDEKLYEEQKYLILSNHYYDPWFLIVNQELYMGFDDETRHLIRNAASSLQSYSRRLAADAEKEGIKKMNEAGISIITPDFSAGRKAVKPAYDWVSNEVGEDTFRQLISVIDNYAPKDGQ